MIDFSWHYRGTCEHAHIAGLPGIHSGCRGAVYLASVRVIDCSIQSLVNVFFYLYRHTAIHAYSVGYFFPFVVSSWAKGTPRLPMLDMQLDGGGAACLWLEGCASRAVVVDLIWLLGR